MKSAIHIPNIEPSLKKQLEQCAGDRDRSLASLCRAILSGWAQNNPANPRPKKKSKK